MRDFPIAGSPRIVEQAERWRRGEIVPAVDRTYPLDQAAAAVRHLLDGHARGKVVITV